MPTDLYLIRHGESVPNVEPVIGGMHGDAGLTARGREQARLLERRLTADPLPASRLYASTLPRAVETAGYVERALGLPVELDEELHELRPGDADGLSFDEVRERYGDFTSPEAAVDPWRALAPGGETRAGFLVRAGAALARLVARHPDEGVVAVCHGGVVEASFYLAFGVSGTAGAVAFGTLNTSITHWRHRPGPLGRAEWTLFSYNDAAHLAGEGAAPEPEHEAVPAPSEGVA